jgi:hypothetical protein
MTNETVAPSENHIKVMAVDLSRSPKPAVLASVRLVLSTESGDSITIDDCRVLRNKQDQLWLAMPSYSVPTNGGRSYEYRPAVVLSAMLRRIVEDAVWSVFKDWEREAVKP